MALMTPEQRPKLVDAVIVFLLLVTGLNGTGPAAHNQPTATEPDVWAFVLVVIAALPVLLWRRFPVPMLAITGGAVSIYLGLGYPFGPIMFSGVLAAGLFASSRPVRTTSLGAGALLLVAAVAVSIGAWDDDLSVYERVALASWSTMWVLVPAAIGVAVRARLEARTRVRAEQARRAVSEEQLRMARELHDVVGHGLAVIAMQAGVGLHVLERNPTKAKESLEAIRDTSKEALEGLRAELAALRAPFEDEPPQRRPASGLADLETLVQRVRSGGLDVTLRMEIGPDDVPADVDESSYRIVQEALTNVLRHAGSEATARVRIRRRESWLLVDVEDTGLGASTADLRGGSGIRGMRARAEELGGRLEAAARDGNGFAVRARLPLAEHKE